MVKILHFYCRGHKFYPVRGNKISHCCLVVKLCLTLLQLHGLYLSRPLLSMGFLRQEYWSGWPFLLQGILLTQGLNSRLLHSRWIFRHLSLQGSPNKCLCTCKFFKAGARGAKHNERESGRKEGEKKERKKGRAGGRQEKARKGGEIKKQRRGWILQLLHTPKSIPPTAIF